MMKKETFWKKAGKDLKKNRGIYLMALPVLAFYICFSYIPIYGLQIAFKNFNLGDGIWEVPGLDWNILRVFRGSVLCTDPEKYGASEPVYHSGKLSGSNPFCLASERSKMEVF